MIPESIAPGWHSRRLRATTWSSADHVEIEGLASKRSPFPITETGYLSHFIGALTLQLCAPML